MLDNTVGKSTEKLHKNISYSLDLRLIISSQVLECAMHGYVI